MHQTSHRGHTKTSTATTQNQLATRRDADGANYRHIARPLKMLRYNTLTNSGSSLDIGDIKLDRIPRRSGLCETTSSRHQFEMRALTQAPVCSCDSSLWLR